MLKITEKPSLEFSFTHNDESYEVQAWHYSQLTIKEHFDYGMTENTYLIFLTGPHEFKPFEIYIAEDLEWHTKSTFLVDEDIVEKIGEVIEHKTM